MTPRHHIISQIAGVILACVLKLAATAYRLKKARRHDLIRLHIGSSARLGALYYAWYTAFITSGRSPLGIIKATKSAFSVHYYITTFTASPPEFHSLIRILLLPGFHTGHGRFGHIWLIIRYNGSKWYFRLRYCNYLPYFHYIHHGVYFISNAASAISL